MAEKSKIHIYEPWFFIFFGLFHMHRIWGLVDRKGYSEFWITTMTEEGLLYYLLMTILSTLCILGIVTFIKNLHRNYWWRWIYILGGSYVLFDLFAIATGLQFWRELLYKMFDTQASYWNVLWSGFIIIGGVSFALGLILLLKRKES